jgi:hypothetical protein
MSDQILRKIIKYYNKLLNLCCINLDHLILNQQSRLTTTLQLRRHATTVNPHLDQNALNFPILNLTKYQMENAPLVLLPYNNNLKYIKCPFHAEAKSITLSLFPLLLVS